MNPVESCLRCEHRQRPPVDGRCACTIDGRDITAHIEAGYCPDPKGARFGAGVVPLTWKSVGLGDTIGKITGALGIKPCPKCKRRQASLNRRAKYAESD